jgi:23S rRNA (uracil-5-)-methyltransferase RumA
VRAEIVGKRRLRGRIREVLKPAPDRIEPPCVYFRDWQCGGCQWQHISYEGQLERKRESVQTAMRRHRLPLAVTAIHAPSDPWRYRSTAGIALGRHAGFRRHGSLAIVPIRDCPISHPLIGSLMASLNQLLEDDKLPDFHGRVRLDVHVVAESDGERLRVLVRPASDATWPDADKIQALTSALLAMDEVSGLAITQSDGSIAPVWGQLFATVLIDGRPVSVAAGGFVQTNLCLLGDLVGRIREEARPLTNRRVADVYGGVGIFGLFLAEEAKEIVVIESDYLAITAGQQTAKQWGLSNVRFIHERAEVALTDAVSHYDVVILDPPRSGLTDPALEALISGRPPLILYVSCLADSLARDLRRLSEAGYDVNHLELFDFYPQTYHVELLAVLRT